MAALTDVQLSIFVCAVLTGPPLAFGMCVTSFGKKRLAPLRNNLITGRTFTVKAKIQISSLQLQPVAMTQYFLLGKGMTPLLLNLKCT